MNTQRSTAFHKISLGLFFLLAAVTSQAQSGSPDPVKEDSAIVKYLGAQDDMIVFAINYQNPNGIPFNLLVRDQDGVELYQGAYRDKFFSRQIRFPKTERNKITFIIRDKKRTDIIKTFEINVNSHFIQDVAVKKLD